MDVTLRYLFKTKKFYNIFWHFFSTFPRKKIHENNKCYNFVFSANEGNAGNNSPFLLETLAVGVYTIAKVVG